MSKLLAARCRRELQRSNLEDFGSSRLDSALNSKDAAAPFMDVDVVTERLVQGGHKKLKDDGLNLSD